jgi:hypothetical protein
MYRRTKTIGQMPKKPAEKSAAAGRHNELTEQEKNEGWMLLFDGESTEGWRGVNKEHFPAGWKIVDGTLHCAGSGWERPVH